MIKLVRDRDSKINVDVTKTLNDIHSSTHNAEEYKAIQAATEVVFTVFDVCGPENKKSNVDFTQN